MYMIYFRIFNLVISNEANLLIYFTNIIFYKLFSVIIL